MTKSKLLSFVPYLILGMITIIGVGYINRNSPAIGSGKVSAANVINCPFEVILVIDASNSMVNKVEGKQKLDWAKEAAKTFVDFVDNSNQTGKIRIGIIAFRSGLVVNNAPSNNYNNVKATIDSISQPGPKNGGTCTSCALQAAYNDYFSLVPTTTNPIVILLSDGGSSDMIYKECSQKDDPNVCHTRSVKEDNIWAEQIRNMTPGVGIYSIGIKSDGCRQDTPPLLCYDENHLKEMTGWIERHYYAQIAAPQWAEKVIEITQRSEFCVAQPSPTPTSIPTP
ncbi:MAG: vWA domain-containing protein, partial [bacterium]